MIEIVLNHPIDYEILKNLYVDKDDLQRAWPSTHEHLLIDVTESPIERPKKRVLVELETFRRIFTQKRRKCTQ
jgi:hypothetical protein